MPVMPKGNKISEDMDLLRMFLLYTINFLTQCIYVYIYNLGEKGDWDFRISDLVKIPNGADI